MSEQKSYMGIDCFRLIAALLIVAIHTSPLASYSETGDFILTRVIARAAVPFFFMTSGFFLISGNACNAEKLGTFIKKTIVIYGAATVLYIPVNIYTGYFRMDNLMPNIIKDVVFDGTFYHLWYLPAAAVGAAIAWGLVKKLNYPKALAAAALLYLIGLFGDSYYGISEKISGLNGFYKLVFQISDYTRNGVFFAPVFFLLGGCIADTRLTITLGQSIRGFCVFFALLLAEALILHHFSLQRHDSMYVFLLPCMYFLFHVILSFKGKRLSGLRTVSLIVYIVHPMIIILIRLFARIFHLQSLLVENSIVQYFMVCLLSVMSGAVLTILWNMYKPEKEKHTAGMDRAYLEISLENLEHNVKVLKRAMPPKCELMAVVKAEAYGHGMAAVAAHINQMGVRAFAVATIDEGIRLRRSGVSGEILILGYTAPSRAKELHQYKLTQTLTDYSYALLLNKQGRAVKAHIKVDTGMHRLGFDWEDTGKIAEVFAMRSLAVCGMYTHLCVSDRLDAEAVSFTRRQIKSFYKVLEELKKQGIAIPKIHIQSSYGLLNYPELSCDYVRAGILLYGVLSSPDDRTKLHLDIKPVLSWKTRIVLLRRIPKGDSVGYGRAFVAGRDSTIAILPVGYADGFPRNLSCKNGHVLINGHRVPVVGRVCMDQLAVDVTDIPDARVGMTVTLIGTDGKEEITAPVFAQASESIANEVLSRTGRRLGVIVKR